MFPRDPRAGWALAMVLTVAATPLLAVGLAALAAAIRGMVR